MASLQCANSLTSAADANACDSLNAAGHTNIDSAASSIAASAGTHSVWLGRILHKTSMPNNKAGTRKPKMSRTCAAPNRLGPAAGAAIAQDFVDIQTTIT